MSYATLDQARLEQTSNPTDFTSTTTDDQLIGNLRRMTSRIDRLIRPDWRFEPMKQTRYFAPYGYHVDVYTGKLLLEAPLLEASTVVDSDGTTLTAWDGVASTLSSADYRVEKRHETPFSSLLRLSGGDFAQWASPSTPAAQITVTGFWGLRRDYTRNGFVDSTDDVQDDGGISASVVAVTVTDADGDDTFGDSPRFSPGQLIRIDDEFLRVLAVDTTNNILTVRRGENGTTAATHALNATISTWYPDENIVRICARGAAFMQWKSGKYENATIDGAGVIVTPADLLAEVAGVMSTYPNYVIPRVV